VVTINQNRRSRSAGISGHDRQNTHHQQFLEISFLNGSITNFFQAHFWIGKYCEQALFFRLADMDAQLSAATGFH